ncbi:MAG: hypothetical protein WBF43_08905 [Methylocella sp.]
MERIETPCAEASATAQSIAQALRKGARADRELAAKCGLAPGSSLAKGASDLDGLAGTLSGLAPRLVEIAGGFGGLRITTPSASAHGKTEERPMASFNKLDTGGRAVAVVYVLWVSGRNPAAPMDVRGVYADARAAADACAAPINNGKQAHIGGAAISTPGMIGEDGEVWLYRGPGSASFTAFGDVSQADTRRQQFGEDVRAHQVIGMAPNAGAESLKAYQIPGLPGVQVYGGLRKRAARAIDPCKKGYDGSAYGLTPEICKEFATRAPAETRRAAAEIIKLAQTRPYDFFARRSA